ncbi:MAG: signal peptidase I [Firmicutes bacterium]|nr:signal peptidase I [Bacillota bacterium]
MKEFIKDIIIALIIVAAITVVIKPTIVKESSMEPTLYENNYLIIYKLAYFHKDHPGYGDIVVFRSDIDKDDGTGKKLLIKRVIGVEGDVMTISDGKVYRNGKLLDEPYVHGQRTETQMDEDVNNLKVPEDQMFLMGDNREVSLDSRSPVVGTVSEDSLVGKAVLRLYPFNEITRL